MQEDNRYEFKDICFIIDEEIEKEISYIEIDYVKEYWGEDFVITTIF